MIREEYAGFLNNELYNEYMDELILVSYKNTEKVKGKGTKFCNDEIVYIYICDEQQELRAIPVLIDGNMYFVNELIFEGNVLIFANLLDTSLEDRDVIMSYDFDDDISDIVLQSHIFDKELIQEILDNQPEDDYIVKIVK